MVLKAKTVKWKILESELEALLTEAELIRIYQPPVNILLKDDKSPIYLLITDELFPRVLTIRKRELLYEQGKGTVLGPFQSAYKLQEVLKLVRPIFTWCNQKPVATSSVHGNTPHRRPCFYYHLHQCPGACVGEISAEDYQENITRLIHFLRGKAKEVTTELSTKMQLASTAENYEKALLLRNQVLMIKEVTSKDYRLSPDIIPSTHISATSEAHRLALLKQLLLDHQHLPTSYTLSRIEAYDVSNIQGQHAAVSMVTAIDGHITPAEYKLFNIKTIDTPNDYHMLQEAILRRHNHPEWGVPKALLIDGGKGQIRAVLRVLRWKVAVIGITKHPDRIMIPIFHWNNWADGETPPIGNMSWKAIALPDEHPLTPLIKGLRDEAHRFANLQRKKLAQKSFFS